MHIFRNLLIVSAGLSLLWMTACKNPSGKGQEGELAGLRFDSTNAGLKLPDGFRAVTVAENIGKARHLVVRDNGDIYVALGSNRKGGGIVALRDTNRDG